jgi:CRP-like cAMP-binding protein
VIATSSSVARIACTEDFAAAREPTHNRLLAALPADAQRRLFPHLRPTNMPLGTAVNEAGQKLTHAYFPTNGIISLLHAMADGASAEVAIVGNERTSGRAIVHSPGSAFRLPLAVLRRKFNANSETRMMMLRYTQSLITQMAQTAVCSRHHTIDERLCRWLLLSLDRLPGKRLKMTREIIALMLGVRREGVTAAACRLQHLGVIECRRGSVAVLDRAKLERLGCECYAVVKGEARRLGPVSRGRAADRRRVPGRRA